MQNTSPLENVNKFGLPNKISLAINGIQYEATQIKEDSVPKERNDKHWQVLAFIANSSFYILGNNNPNFFIKIIGDHVPMVPADASLRNVDIFSIKRVSDGCIFFKGDYLRGHKESIKMFVLFTSKAEENNDVCMVSLTNHANREQTFDLSQENKTYPNSYQYPSI